MSLLNQLPSTTKKPSKRVGRGYGSGKGGHTCGRGQKGQNSRQGKRMPTWFEGGQLPMIKRMPMMRGKSRFESLEPTAELTLTDVDKMKAAVISLDTLKLEKVIDPRFKKAKIISNGQINRVVTIQGVRVSTAAKTAIVTAGGKVE
jgi:large subunit ribosomal protein L15